MTLVVDETLRDYKGSILVGVTDKWGKNDQQNLQIQFCGCEDPSQCASFTGAISESEFIIFHFIYIIEFSIKFFGSVHQIDTVLYGSDIFKDCTQLAPTFVFLIAHGYFTV